MIVVGHKHEAQSSLHVFVTDRSCGVHEANKAFSLFLTLIRNFNLDLFIFLLLNRIIVNILYVTHACFMFGIWFS